MTRDNPIWLWLIAASILSTFSAHFDLLEMCCDLGDKTKAMIELASLTVASVAGVFYKSPLQISDKGRAKYQRDRVKL